MRQPYIDAIKARAPQAVLVFDKFHIVRHLMEAVDQVRRDEGRERGPAHKALMCKTRFIWLKNPWNLDLPPPMYPHPELGCGCDERSERRVGRRWCIAERTVWADLIVFPTPVLQGDRSTMICV